MNPRLIRGGLAVSPIGFGASWIGINNEAISDVESTAIVRRALDLEVNYLDTAPFYGHGRSETRLGAALAACSRSDFVVSTKVGRRVTRDSRASSFDWTADGIERSFVESLERLGLADVDILFVHDPEEHMEEALHSAPSVLERLRAQKLVKTIGVGSSDVEAHHRFLDVMDVDCILLANRYSLLEQPALATLLPRCLERSIGVVLGGVYNTGILTDPQRGATFDYQPAPPDKLARAQAINEVCAEHRVSLKAAALQFAWAHPAVVSVLVGIGSREQLEENVALFRESIPARLWQDLRDRRLLPENAPVPP